MILPHVPNPYPLGRPAYRLHVRYRTVTLTGWRHGRRWRELARLDCGLLARYAWVLRANARGTRP